MVQYIKQPSIFGRMGTGIGKGLSEQIPKEIERARLASGLSQFEKESGNLNPVQQVARLSAIPGITPQMIQSMSELARQQAQKNAFSNAVAQAQGQMPERTISRKEEIQNQQFSPTIQGIGRTQEKKETTRVSPSEFGQPQIVPESPLSEKFMPRIPWTPEQRNQKIQEYHSLGFLPQQARELAAEDEQRELSEPAAYRKRQEELTGIQKEARGALTRHLETKLQKKGEDVFRDIPGEYLVNAERGMEKDLRLNPRASLEDVANDWSNRLLDTAKTKTQLNKLAEKTDITSFFKGNETYLKLKEYSDIFKHSGNSEEFFNLLQENFGMSPQGAASIAYPINKDIKNYVSKWKGPGGFPILTSTLSKMKGEPLHNELENIENRSRRAALEIGPKITSDQSLLSIAQSLSAKDPYFDQKSFFEQLSEDKNDISLTTRQARELAEGKRDILPHWGDIKILPFFKEKK